MALFKSSHESLLICCCCHFFLSFACLFQFFFLLVSPSIRVSFNLEQKFFLNSNNKQIRWYAWMRNEFEKKKLILGLIHVFMFNFCKLNKNLSFSLPSMRRKTLYDDTLLFSISYDHSKYKKVAVPFNVHMDYIICLTLAVAH